MGRDTDLGFIITKQQGVGGINKGCSKKRAQHQGLILEENQEEPLGKKRLEKCTISTDSKLHNFYILKV